MKVAFRADASLEMGTGHIMRCLTLADALTVQGAECQFICREHQGNLIEFIRNKSYHTHALPISAEAGLSDTQPGHAAWLGCSQEQDATDCVCALSEMKPDWLVVDHYALDARWEQALKPHYRKLMVIDDLADRPHLCDLLLDQTFGRDRGDYHRWVPSSSTVLCGSRYALLRPEFAKLRDYSLQRRAKPLVRKLLITMGGVDKDNVTGRVLKALRHSPLPEECQITVVMGSTAPWLSEVDQLAKSMPWPTQVMAGVSDMAQLMADSDLAIGAAGATSWERCCLGLPTIMLVLAENQSKVARELKRRGASLCIPDLQNIDDDLCSVISALIDNPETVGGMSNAARLVTAGLGVSAVTSQMRHIDG